MRIALLHTSDTHVPRFAGIFAALAPQARLHHAVRADLLSRAAQNGLADVAKDFTALAGELLQADALLCTCSTLGPLVDGLGDPRAVRIDRPLMQAACQAGPRLLVAYCLASTQAATMTLLQDTASGLGANVTATPLLCDQAWRLFEAGDLPGYHRAIAQSVTTALAASPADCVVLAQASMDGAGALLRGCGLPVLGSPITAAQATLDAAGRAL